MFWVLKDKLYPTKSITRHSGTQFEITIISPTKMTTSFALQKTIFATMKKKLADAENRVRELEEENMALHFFANIGYDNVDLDDLEYDNEPATCTDDESCEVANTVDTLVDTIEMTHADVAVEHPDKSAHYKHWEAWFSQNKIANGMAKLRILFRFAKKVVQYRRQRIALKPEIPLWQAFDFAIECSHRAQLHAHKFAQYAEDAVNLMLENLDEEPMNEEIDDVVASTSSDDEDESVESIGEIQQRIANKIEELKNIYVQNESTLNHKHSDLTKTNVRDCLKMISTDYEKKLKSLNPKNYKYEHIVVHELKQLEYKVDHEIKDMLANVEHSKASQISYTMTHTPEPDWLHTIEEDGLAYYTECSGEQNLYRLSMSGSLMQVGSYKRERDDDGYKVRVLSFLAEPVVATEPVPTPTPTPLPSPSPASLPPPSPLQPSSPSPSQSPSPPHYADECPFDNEQILGSYTYENGFTKAMKKKDVIDPARNWKHFVHDVNPLDEKATVCRFVFAKYDKSIDSPVMDDMSYEIHYYSMWKYETATKKGRKLLVNGTALHWEPSRIMWKRFLTPQHGLKSPDDISIYGCKV